MLIREIYSNTNTSSSTNGSRNLLNFDFINVFNTIQNTSYSYCQRIRGWFQVEVTGNYTFYTSCSNACQLYLSTNNDPANMTQVANQTIPSGISEWNKYVLVILPVKLLKCSNLSLRYTDFKHFFI